MSALGSVEQKLENVFKGAPKLSDKAREMIAGWTPWINLVLGILGLWAAWGLWHWAHFANGLINYANQLNQAYGTGTVVADRLTVGLWISLAVLVVESIIYLMAFSPTKDRKRSGWNLMFYAVVLNAVYGLVLLLTDYGNVGSLIGYVIGAVIGLYFLFQIKPKFTK